MATDIRDTDPADPRALAAMRAYFAELDAVFPGGFDPAPLTGASLADMRPPHGAFLLACDGAQTFACVGLRREDGTTGEVKRLWVSPAARGQGLAPRMMAALTDRARKRGMTRLILDTSAHLPGAVALYHRLGWTEIARYNDNPYAHHFFEMRL